MIEWQQNPPKEPISWHKAIEYAESLGDGWRLPTRAELIDVCDNNVEGFNGSFYWSSSTYARDTTYAWYVDFDDGGVGYSGKTGNGFVRCIREVKQ